MLKLTLVFLLTAACHQALAAKDQNGMWVGTFAKKAIALQYSLWAEAQMRYSFDQGGMGQTLYRTGALKSLNPSHELGLLYGFVQAGLQKSTGSLFNTDKFTAILPD